MLQTALATVSVDRGKRASQQVYEAIRSAIISLKLLPNQPISDYEVASLLAVSRTPVREAFIRLAEEGLLTTYPQLATVISPIRLEAIYEAQFLREAVEGSIAARAAEQIEPAHATRLRATLEEHEVAWEAGDWGAFYMLDERTHRLVGEIAGLAGVLKHLEPARAQLDRMRHVVLPERDTALRVIQQHRVFILAICNREPGAAQAAMTLHTRDILGRLPDLQARRPELFADKPASRTNGRR